ncbi:hypothetical protein C8E02_0714 [Vogesella indigofera]|uniref:Uncharacterized protein n=1 Tax=Vogesella indigofera TaxID=45465 RepID=A0A495BHX1_VOGIN|nr:hypothetical protein [Vogesella indigofera]RKQ60949.1 hypothetical protein C8E02_0714 [Vogesella indigofera]
MLTFKTQFPIAVTTKMSAFMDCCRTWIIKSPHTKLANSIPYDVHEGSFGDEHESVRFALFESATTSTGGVRYEKTDNDEVRWITDVIGHKSNNSFWVSVQLSVDSELPVERLEQGKRPYIVKLLISTFAGGHDGDLPVTDNPIFLSTSDTDFAAKIICAGTGSVMPVVYISRNHAEELIIDPIQLAKWLSGMAHVVAEPNRKFSSQITRHVYGENVYGGAVAIYWPDGIGKWIYLPNQYDSISSLQAAIVRKIRFSLLYQRLRRECTWSHLQEMTSRQKLEALRASGSGNIDDYIKHFDKEISAKDEEIKRLESELARVRYSKHEMRTSHRDGHNSINLETLENDLYQGEQIGLIVDALKAAKGSAEPHSRRYDILTNLISLNENPGDRDEILDRLKEALRQYTSMNGSVRAEFETCGFVIHEDGKHHKLLFQDDKRYPFTLPKTGSDWRGGLNAFSDLKKRLF